MRGVVMDTRYGAAFIPNLIKDWVSLLISLSVSPLRSIIQ
jgi:hypothetical protein